MAQKNYASQNVEHEKPVILYLQHFFCTSAVYLLIGQNVNAKTNMFHEMQFWSNFFFFLLTFWSLVNKPLINRIIRFYSRPLLLRLYVLASIVFLCHQRFRWERYLRLIASPAGGDLSTSTLYRFCKWSVDLIDFIKEKFPWFDGSENI